MHQLNNDGTYGAKKVWKELTREGIGIAICMVRRLMKDEGLSGVRRGRQFRVTTISDENQHRPSDLVERQFVASAPNRLLRQYFPKGTDMGRYFKRGLDTAARSLNTRPRKTLGWRTPAEALYEFY